MKMPINADKPHLWKSDIHASVDLFNNWFVAFAPKAYRDTRIETTKSVAQGLRLTKDLTAITPEVLTKYPTVLPTLRMCTCPPLARDRLVGLAGANKSLILVMEHGKIPPHMPAALLKTNIERITATITKMLDTDIFPWLANRSLPTDEERYRSSTIVADRLCGAVSDPIVRNAQEKRQLALISEFLTARGYKQTPPHPSSAPLTEMRAGTFSFRMSALVGESKKVKIPIDVVIQPKSPRPTHLPILVEAKSAGDFTNVNKRRKEEATKMRQLKSTYGKRVEFILFLNGYFDGGYLGYEAAEGIDWIWEHRIGDLKKLGL